MIKNIFILLFAISILYPQVNIESMRKNNSNDGSWHKLGFDLGFVTGKKSEVMNLHGASISKNLMGIPDSWFPSIIKATKKNLAKI